MYPKSAKEARELKEKYYYTGEPCKHGHYSVRSSNNLQCMECRKSEHVKKKSRKWRLDNLEKSKRRTAEWKRQNPEKVRSYVAKRDAIKKGAVPEWVDWDEIEYIYSLAKEKDHVVDHMVPLISDKVCGLHVGDNLRVIPAELNQLKHNRYWPDMWSYEWNEMSLNQFREGC